MGIQKSAGMESFARPVASLSLPEQVVVWGLRRYRSAGEGLAPLGPMFERIFGAAAVAALERFARLIRELERLPRGRDAGFLSQRLSRVETLLLGMMASLQDGEGERAAGIAARLAGPDAGEGLIAAAGSFATALAKAGYPLGDARPCAPGSATLRPPADHQLPAAVVIADLVAPELLVLHAVRLWVVSIRLQQCSYERIARHFCEHGLPDAAPSLHAIMHRTSVAAARQVDVRCPPCRLLSPDEARLLHAVASAQGSERDEAFETLNAWLPLAAARLTLKSVVGLAEALLGGGVELPSRRWDFDRLERLTAAAPATEPENCRLH